tara:strand:+ start:7639 stop:7884 length:246 start_codon:yes stop_codon:yes gene_type:complete
MRSVGMAHISFENFVYKMTKLGPQTYTWDIDHEAAQQYQTFYLLLSLACQWQHLNLSDWMSLASFLFNLEPCGQSSQLEVT